MSEPEFQLRISGERVAPDAIDVEDLVHVLVGLRKALVLTAQLAEGSGALALSLVGIGKGSVRCRMVLSEAVRPAAVLLTAAVAQAEYAKIPFEARVVLSDLSKQVVRRRWSLDIEPEPGSDLFPIRIGEGAEFPDPTQGAWLGTTRLYGELLRVGGVDPTILMRLQEGTRPVSVAVSIEIAHELSSRLYQEIGIECEAKWSGTDLKPVWFRALRVLPYQHTDLLDALKELARASAGRYDNVDALEFVKQLRAEDEDE